MCSRCWATATASPQCSTSAPNTCSGTTATTRSSARPRPSSSTTLPTLAEDRPAEGSVDRHPANLGNVDDREPSAAGPIRSHHPDPRSTAQPRKPANHEAATREAPRTPPRGLAGGVIAAGLPRRGQPGGLDMVRAAVNALAENDRAPLLACADHLWTTPLITAAAEYSKTFDWRRRRTPFLTYLFRPHIVYRSRDAARPGEPIGSGPRRRGW